MRHPPRVLLVGCGNMGQALLRGWLAAGWTPADVRVVDPGDVARAAAEASGVAVSVARPAALEADVVVLAVKPQQLEAVVPEYRDLSEAGAVVLTIAAGKPIPFYERILGMRAPLVRAMPNTPAAIGQGMTVLVPNAAVDAGGREACEALMAAVGRVAWLEDEGLMDAVTGVSGSGPAYVFLLIESLTQAGVAMGLAPALAGELAVTTVAGAGALALGSDVDAAELRRRVTSPGGTTEAALAVLMKDDALARLFEDAVRAATERGRALA